MIVLLTCLRLTVAKCMEHTNTFFTNTFLSGCIRGVPGEGMPIYRRSTTNGNLYIRFSVIFPEKNFLDQEKLKVSFPSLTALNLSFVIF